MARTRSPDRLEHLLDCATQIFIERSYRQTKMAEVALKAQISPGTLYLYFEGKEALFNVVIRRAFLLENFVPPATFPIPAEPLDEVLEFIQGRYDEEWRLHTLELALERRQVPDTRAEFEGIVRELYMAMERYRFAIRVIEKSAHDWPALFDLHFKSMRRRIIQQLSAYLEKRIGQKLLPPLPDIAISARVILENVAWFAMHRYYAPDAATIGNDMARETVVHFLVNAVNSE